MLQVLVCTIQCFHSYINYVYVARYRNISLAETQIVYIIPCNLFKYDLGYVFSANYYELRIGIISEPNIALCIK